jgi:uncharacterized OsmC-like protein
MPAGVVIELTLSGTTAQLTHGPSAAKLRTVPPADNGGDGSSFSPTDLLAASLASCAITTMALVAGREGLSFGDARARVEKHMAGPPRRVGALDLVITMPAAVRAEHRARLEEIARGCPVARSLAADVAVTMKFEYP